MELWIGNSKALINGKEVQIDEDNPSVKPLIIDDRTMLPLRFVVESLGCDVYWDPDTRSAAIVKSPPLDEEGNKEEKDKEEDENKFFNPGDFFKK